MMEALNKAKALLRANGYTCVVCKGEQVAFSTERGVKPLLDWYEGGVNFTGYSVADKVVGKATAFLYLLLGIRSVYAGVISRSALKVLQREKITVEYGELVEHIVNRRGDGICPFEAAVLEIEDSTEAYAAIVKRWSSQYRVNSKKRPVGKLPTGFAYRLFVELIV